jgi:hypothetical protein
MTADVKSEMTMAPMARRLPRRRSGLRLIFLRATHARIIPGMAVMTNVKKLRIASTKEATAVLLAVEPAGSYGTVGS